MMTAVERWLEFLLSIEMAGKLMPEGFWMMVALERGTKFLIYSRWTEASRSTWSVHLCNYSLIAVCVSGNVVNLR